MNKTAIKNYAIWARVQLIEAVKQKAYEYEITDDGENKPGRDTIGGRLLSRIEKEQRGQLIAEINRKGFSQVMEEAAYTWFNRFIALRFMEVNGYLPSKVRVFTDETGAFKPEILKQAMSVDLEGLDRSNVMDLLDKQNNEELFKYLLIAQCNALNSGLPYMFEKIGGWTELLFPANLLRQDSVIGQMISEIPEEDWTDAVQIIGWLYQYYNSELKDETFALLKKNVKITKERIPAATQLFTPDWIVRYMVENSLGRLWYEGHPDFDKSPWKYYLDDAKQDPEVEAQLQKIRAEYATIKPEEIKVIDPCMGSGHILVYAFDVLMQIYTATGWSERDAAKSILENNLYGLDIDDRAGQLAYFAVMMKARKHSRHILNGDVKPNVLSIQDSNWMTDEFITYVAGKDMTMKADLVMLRKTFRDAKEYGSILNVPSMQYDALYERIDILGRSYAGNIFEAQYHTMAGEQLLPLVKQAQIMAQKYDVVVTNPPYMNQKGMPSMLNNYVKHHYPDSWNDMSTVFMDKCSSMLSNNGFISMINIPSWMFLGSFEQIRMRVLKHMQLINMLHNGRGVFGSDFGSVAFVFQNKFHPHYNGRYKRLFDYQGSVETTDEKEKRFWKDNNEYVISQQSIVRIPGMPVAYWASPALIRAFENTYIEEFAKPCKGIDTGNNELFIRLWYEVFSTETIVFSKESYKWAVFNKGGSYRKWYGNYEYVILWKNNGEKLRKYPKSNIRNANYFFRKGLTWTLLSIGGNFGMRVLRDDAIFDANGLAMFPYQSNTTEYLLALFNSKVAQEYLRILSSTMAFVIGDIKRVPIKRENSKEKRIIELAGESISAAKTDWDAFETSWDFKKHPLI